MKRLRKAFAQMRKEGLLARMNWKCCNNCGTDAMETLWQETGKEAKGYVFYHRQDLEHLEAALNARHTPQVYLTFGVFGCEEDEVETQKVAKTIIKCLIENGLNYIWDGDTNIRILVVL